MDVKYKMYSSFSDSIQFHNGDSQLLGLSLQDMIDSDIKAEFDDINCSNSLGGSFANVDTLELLTDINFKIEDGLLDPISNLRERDAVLSNTPPPTWSSAFDFNSRDASSLYHKPYLEEMGGTGLMVNPVSVMPLSQTSLSRNRQEAQVHPSQYSHVQSLSIAGPTPNTHTVTFSTQGTHSNQNIRGQASNLTFSGMITPGGSGGRINITTLPNRTVRILPPASSPMQMQQVPSPSKVSAAKKKNTSSYSFSSNSINNNALGENGLPKPAYSYSCLIALALKNSFTGSMSVSEIYKFMCEHFPYFQTAPSGWKNSVRHNLSLNKCFEKIEKHNPTGSQRKGCLWTMNPAKVTKMDDEIAKWSRKDPVGIKKGMVHPETLELLERGQMKKDYNASVIDVESEDEDGPSTPASVSSQGSQSDDQQGSDADGFNQMKDTRFQELHFQVSSGVYDDLQPNSPFCNGNYSISSVVHTPGEPHPYNMLVLNGNAGEKVFGI